MKKIMIVEDNEVLKDELCILLQKNGYISCEPNSFNTIVEDVKILNPHLILLDINLPYGDGFSVCSKIRCFSKIPIIFVTNRKSDIDELCSITLGGDDFVTKPFNSAILLARISSVLKRIYSEDENSLVLHYKDVMLNIANSSLTYKKEQIELTATELKIMYSLFINSGNITSRNKIMDNLWDNYMFIDDNTLSVNITRIREKLSRIGLGNFIITKRGRGYMI